MRSVQQQPQQQQAEGCPGYLKSHHSSQEGGLLTFAYQTTFIAQLFAPNGNTSALLRAVQLQVLQQTHAHTRDQTRPSFASGRKQGLFSSSLSLRIRHGYALPETLLQCLFEFAIGLLSLNVVPQLWP